MKVEELRLTEEELKRKSSLLLQYNVIEQKRDGGIEHVHCSALAKLIMNECGYFFRTIEDIGTGQQQLYYYRNGLYILGGENRIKEKVDYFLDDLTTIHRKSEVVDIIKHKEFIDRNEMEPPVNLINVKNGIYDLATDKLLPHDPKYFFINQIPVEYKPDAKCPTINKFFESVLYPEFVPLMQEIFGYCLYRDYIFHKSFLFLGGGRNGKGTMVNLLGKFLGQRENCSSIDLIRLTDNRFAASNLYGKLANMSGETPAKALENTGPFKNLCGNEEFGAEFKFGASFSFKNYAKLIFNSNHMPHNRYDKSLAFFQRWIIIPFPKTFDDDNEDTDRHIFEKIQTKEELEGLLIYSLEGLKRLLENENFSYEIAEESIGEIYESMSRPEKIFMDEKLEFVRDVHLNKNKVYEKYKTWAENKRFPVLTPKVFTSALKSYFHKKRIDGVTDGEIELSHERHRNDDVKTYKNINWKPGADEDTKVHSLDVFDDEDNLENSPLAKSLKQYNSQNGNMLEEKLKKAERLKKEYLDDE